MHHFPVAFILTGISFIAQDRPGIFDSNAPGAAYEVVGNFRTPIGKAFSLPFRREEDELFFRDCLCFAVCWKLTKKSNRKKYCYAFHFTTMFSIEATPHHQAGLFATMG